jgi:hypothetical protein
MDSHLRPLVDFLSDLGLGEVGHTGKTYLGHVVALYHYLQRQGCSDEVCRAGLFHSIYGTELFQGFKLPLERRDEIRHSVGERAEWLAYLNCAMDRTSFDAVVSSTADHLCFKDRFTQQEVVLGKEDFDDLCRIHLYDWLEQVPRSRSWEYRRASYRQMAQRLGAEALSEYDRVFAAEQSI